MTTKFEALHTDLYQLTMAQGYWKLGLHLRTAAFELYYRENPFEGGYALASGLNEVIDWIRNFHFSPQDIEYLRTLKAREGSPLFQEDFLQALLSLRLSVDITAIEEGTPVFPKEPLIQVQGPLWQCQLLETMLLNLINFATLIATKASRVCHVADGSTVVEFGLRRAQGPNGGLTASRAAYVGGVGASSNVLAGSKFGIPVAGTHAHSWVMAFEDDYQAFEAYAKAMPNNCIFLVDTYQSLRGVEQAIKVGLELKKTGHEMIGIRLDSGDLAELSIQARSLLDKAGLNNAQIVASSDLDEYTIEKMKKSGAKIDIWGVGTRLVTAYDQPALGGVYKMVAMQNESGQWVYKSKKTDDARKQTLPGVHNVRRVEEKGVYQKDIIYDIYSKPKIIPNGQDLLLPIFKAGELVYDVPTLDTIQKKAKMELQKLPISIRDLKPRISYPVELLES